MQLLTHYFCSGRIFLLDHRHDYCIRHYGIVSRTRLCARTSLREVRQTPRRNGVLYTSAAFADVYALRQRIKYEKNIKLSIYN